LKSLAALNRFVSGSSVPPSALHPEDRPDPAEETGPWLLAAAVGTVGWLLLVAVDWQFLASGTSPWALVRSAYSLLLAPFVAAAVFQDDRVRTARGSGVGRVRWLYAGVALFFPPVIVAYVGHRRFTD
jgi:hypothetical protein